MNAQIFSRNGDPRRKYVSVLRTKGSKRARTEAHFWGMVRDALNDSTAGEHRYCWVLTRPHKYAMTSMSFALSRGRNREEMIVDNHYAVRDVRALYNAGETVELGYMVNV